MDQQSATADALLLTVNVAALLCRCSAGRVIPSHVVHLAVTRGPLSSSSMGQCAGLGSWRLWEERVRRQVRVVVCRVCRQTATHGATCWRASKTSERRSLYLQTFRVRVRDTSLFVRTWSVGLDRLLWFNCCSPSLLPGPHFHLPVMFPGQRSRKCESSVLGKSAWSSLSWTMQEERMGSRFIVADHDSKDCG